jgi:hypothetical protein
LRDGCLDPSELFLEGFDMLLSIGFESDGDDVPEVVDSMLNELGLSERGDVLFQLLKEIKK